MLRITTLLFLALLTCPAGCGDGAQEQTLTVFAASSLTEPLSEAARAFETSHAGTKLNFNFAGSPALRTQLEQGARADLLATADQQNMEAALAEGLVRDAGTTFANNRLAIIVPKSGSARIASPVDLAQPDLKLVLAAPDVPAGRYARDALRKMAADPAFPTGFESRVLANVVSEEANVKAVVAKVQLGEADAGIVYATDITPGVAGDIAEIAIPAAYNVVAAYPIALTRDPAEPVLADLFTRFLLSDEGQAILQRRGFIGVK